jgi:hypothetical protein
VITAGGLVLVDAMTMDNQIFRELTLSGSAKQHDTGVIEVVALEDETPMAEIAVVTGLD